MAALADLVALVSLLAVKRVAILMCVNGDRGDPELVGGSKGADRDLSAVGDEQLGDHGSIVLVPRAAVEPSIRRMDPRRDATVGSS